jgi:hypothetical protein
MPVALPTRDETLIQVCHTLLQHLGSFSGIAQLTCDDVVLDITELLKKGHRCSEIAKLLTGGAVVNLLEGVCQQVERLIT